MNVFIKNNDRLTFISNKTDISLFRFKSVFDKKNFVSINNAEHFLELTITNFVSGRSNQIENFMTSRTTQ